VESADVRLRLRSVARLARVLAEPQELLDLLETAANEMRFALGAASVSLGRLERERGVVRTLINVGDLASWELPRPEDETYSIHSLPMMALLVDEARSYIVDIDDGAGDPASLELLVASAKGSGIAAPILLDGRIWGELWATRGMRDARYEDTDIEVAEALAAVLAAGIAQSERYSQVEHLIYTDPLTGLANRRAIDLALERALEQHEATGSPVSVVMSDVNGLKVANDVEGHDAGDRLIRACADAISRATGLAPGAIAGRIGGDEFAVVLPGLTLEQTEPLAASIITALNQGVYAGSLAVGASSTSVAGIEGDVTARRLLGWADEAQYAAKREGSHRVLLAGRDTPLTDPVERRRRRRSGPAWSTNAERAANALEAGLRVLATSVELSALDRLVAVIDAAAEVIGASGWVISIIDDGCSRTVAFSSARDGLDVDTGHDTRHDPTWLQSALGAGVLVRADDESAALARVRRCTTVAAAASGRWLVELLGDDDAVLVAAPAPLRALVGTALAG